MFGHHRDHGREQTTPATWFLGRWLAGRIFGIVFLAAFASLLHQGLGLIGSEGLRPAAEGPARDRAEYGMWALVRAPSLFWLCSSDDFWRRRFPVPLVARSSWSRVRRASIGAACAVLILVGVAQLIDVGFGPRPRPNLLAGLRAALEPFT